MIFFKELYTKKFYELFDEQNIEIDFKHSRIMNSFNGGNFILTFRYEYTGNDLPQQRMDKIYSYPLWNKLVDNYNYITVSNLSGKYIEIWNLKIYAGFLTKKEIKQIYKEVCWKIDSGNDFNYIDPDFSFESSNTTENKEKTAL